MSCDELSVILNGHAMAKVDPGWQEVSKDIVRVYCLLIVLIRRYSEAMRKVSSYLRIKGLAMDTKLWIQAEEGFVEDRTKRFEKAVLDGLRLEFSKEVKQH